MNQKITRLMGAIDGYSGPPTSRQLADIEECAAQLQKGLEEVTKLDGEVPRLNKLMQDAGVPYVTVDINNVLRRARRPGRRKLTLTPVERPFRLPRRHPSKSEQCRQALPMLPLKSASVRRGRAMPAQGLHLPEGDLEGT